MKGIRLLVAIVLLVSCKGPPLQQPFRVTTSGMSETIKVGQLVTPIKTKRYKFNDIVIYKYPPKETEIRICRIKGMPGDTLNLKDNVPFIDGKKKNDPKTALLPYILNLKSNAEKQYIFNHFKILVREEITQDSYIVHLTELNCERIKKDTNVLSITPEKSVSDSFLFPSNNPWGWSLFNYGPLYIPKKGDSLEINSSNLNLYSYILTNYENISTTTIDEKINTIGKFIVRLNHSYYFLIGDNRSNCADSRYWGFLPDINLIGLAKLN